MKSALIDGVALGLQYGLLGAGMTLIYGLAGILNLAHGQIAVGGAIIVSLAHGLGIAIVPAIGIGVATAALVMLLLDQTILRLVYRQGGGSADAESSDRESKVLVGLLVMLGVSFIIESLFTWRWPSEQLGIRIGGDPISVLGVPLTTGTVVASLISLGVGGALLVFFGLTVLGRGVRSVIEDEIGARLVGINPAAVRTFVLLISGALAALVAVTRSMTGPVGLAVATDFTIMALIVAVVGGLGSVHGAFVAGLLLGVVDRLSSFYIGSYVTTIVLLVCAALTILLRPAGLLGRVAP